MTVGWAPVFHPEEGPSLPGAVYQALGAASMCWDPRPDTQVFATEEATAVAEGLLRFIRGHMHQQIETLSHAPACPGDQGCWCPIGQMMALVDKDAR